MESDAIGDGQRAGGGEREGKPSTLDFHVLSLFPGTKPSVIGAGDERRSTWATV